MSGQYANRVSLACAGLSLVIAIVSAAPAFAQLKKEATHYLTRPESEAALFGIDMQGFSPSDSVQWRECVTPRGETLYQVGDSTLKGRLRISDAGEACFSYEDTSFEVEHCFRTRRKGSGFILRVRQDRSSSLCPSSAG